MSIKKQYLKSKTKCKVTLSFPPAATKRIQKVNVVGEFNNWNQQATEMKPQKDGSFKAILELDENKDYQFRYLIDHKRWKNDPEADGFVPNNLTGDENSVISV